MKSLCIAILCLSSLGAMAAPSPEATRQLDSDIHTFLTEKSDGKLDSDKAVHLARELREEIVAEFPQVVVFSAEELRLASNGTALVSDASIEAAYKKLQAIAGKNPPPVMVGFYKSKYDQGALDPLQKAIYFKLTSAITIFLESGAGKAQ